MKKLMWASCIALMSFVACDKVKDGNEPINPSDQKAKLENLAEKLMDKFPANDYEELASTSSGLISYCIETIGEEDYDLTELEEVFQERYGKMFSEEFISETMTSYTYLFLLSECKGHLTFGKDAVTYEDSEDTIVEITDGEGVVWTLSIVPSGKVQKVYLGEFVRSRMDYNQTMYEDYYYVTVEIPENLAVTLKKNGKDYSSMVLNTDVRISEEGIDIEKDKIAISATVMFEGMELSISNAAYDASTGVLELSSALRKDGELIISEKISAVGKIYLESENWTAKNINVEVDMMGLMQIKGTCPDANSIYNIIENADPENAEEWGEYVEKLNKLFELGVYFDGGSLMQAKLVLEPRFQEEEWGSRYYVEFAIEFNDGSRYLFEDYFSEDNFSGTVGEAESFLDKYVNLLEKYFGAY